ncbi:hypothetical protein Taro_003644 [Colocasia esculenta]|uniref:Glycosyltransferase n=1 Tax=Colocasia esculenta TaxID=4460 RepID=A0A843TP94_COLES|nr:hypothetical protein [Colocasia esculenta]
MANTAASPDGEPGVVVVMVPFPAQGHLNQLLHLSRLVAAHGVPVHFVGSATHNRQARVRVHGWDLAAFPKIHFQDLPVPHFPSPPPEPRATVKFPAHLQPAFEASAKLQAPLAPLLRSLSATARRVVVVHDSLMPFAAREAAGLPNAESYVFHSVSALAKLFFQWAARGKLEEKRPVVPAGIPLLPLDGCYTEEFLAFLSRQFRKTPPDVAGRLLNTCRTVEPEFIDLLAREPFLQRKRLFAVGPLNPVELEDAGAGGPVRPRHRCLEWLDRQPPHSVVYVSFGTTSSMSSQQIRELAAGLESSRQRFIWVLRNADRGDIFAAGEGVDAHKWQQRERDLQLPEDYERRVAGLGLVVREWTPQLGILGHRSTGLFMTHCGWNSCMEGLSMGVPMAAWPLHSDQPNNAVLVTEVLKVGVTVREWAQRDETVPSAAVEDAIRRIMVSGEGSEMRKRARELGASIRAGVSEGGSTVELDSFIAHITR